MRKEFVKNFKEVLIDSVIIRLNMYNKNQNFGSKSEMVFVV
jgi:hypothetical protein